MKKSYFIILILSAYFLTSCQFNSKERDIDWPVFMHQHDMIFDEFPAKWNEAPHFGNAMIGSMLYKEDNCIRLEVFRADVHDHRDDTYGWPAYSRPHFRIGYFLLHPEGRLTGCKWKMDLWNAELTGTIRTSKGEIAIRHFTHAQDMAIFTEITPSKGEKKFFWTWHPFKAESSRGISATNEAERKAFAEKYGSQYLKELKLYKPNPDGREEESGNQSVWIQDLLAGGQYATAWTESQNGDTRTQIISIANSYPESTATESALKNVKHFSRLNLKRWRKTHRDWWHRYYKKSFVTIPDKSLESLYWQTIYRYGSTSRTGRYYVDCSGLWFQGGPWPYTTTDWNIQCAHWPVYTANRLEQGQELLERFYKYKENLIKAVRPVEWQNDAAYLPIEVAGDMAGYRWQDKRYSELFGTLPWAMNNLWSQYRYSMDDDMLREKIYPLLRRSMNMYLHLVKEGEDGKLHLPPTYSPETGLHEDCNFDLALFKWGCYTLLKASKRLGIDDPLIPQWKNVVQNLVDFPVDENGFRLGSDQTSSPTHRHLSNLLMIYPLYLVNIEQEGTTDVLMNSYNRVHHISGLPAMVQSHAGPIRIFPAMPSEWKDAEFRNLRTEGAFLVSAKRTDGKTRWVRIKSLAGEPCRIKHGFSGEIRIKKSRSGIKIKEVSPGIIDIELKKGDQVLLYE